MSAHLQQTLVSPVSLLHAECVRGSALALGSDHQLHGASDELLLQSESVDVVVVSQGVFSHSLSVNSSSHSFAVFLLLFVVAF